MSKQLHKNFVFAFDSVTFGYPNSRPLVSDLSFTVRYGESVAILATEGAGRSTLLKLMVGMATPTKGECYLNEFPISRLPETVLNEYRAQIGFLFSKGALVNNLTLFDNIALPLRYHAPLSEETISIQVDQVMAKFRISPYKAYRPAFVSEYVRCMTGVARAYLMTPPVMLVDNIFDGLGRSHVSHVAEVIHEMKQHSEGTFVFASNDPEFIQSLATRVVFLSQGHLHFDGTFPEFFASADPVIRSYIRETKVETLTLPELKAV